MSESDLQETPAVPPEEYYGDERAGFLTAGAALVTLGWVLGIGVNLWLHLTAPAGGTAIGGVVIHHALGAYAWAAIIIGALTGALGVAIAITARSSPRGRLVLPGGVY